MYASYRGSIYGNKEKIRAVNPKAHMDDGKKEADH